MEVGLTHEGLSRLEFDKDFELKTNDGSIQVTIKCSRSQIAFLSPAVSKLLANDPTIKEFTLNTENSSKCSLILQSLLNGSKATVSDDLMKIFLEISIELGNNELLAVISDNLTPENVIEIVQIKNAKEFNIDKEIEFIASHYMECDNSVNNLDIAILDAIYSSESLIIHDELTFLYEIKRLIEKFGDEYRMLLRHLHLIYLDLDDIGKFFDLIDQSKIDCYLPCMKKRMLCPISFMTPDEDISRFCGIFKEMWKKANGNPMTNGLVDIEETTNSRQEYVSYLIDQEMRDQEGWSCVTDSSKGGSFIFDFKEKYVCLHGYMLKAHSREWSSDNFLKSWRLEGSDDKMEWEIIDEHIGSNILLANMAEGYWSFQMTQSYRYIKLKMTDKNSSGSYKMALQAIEFFGLIQSSDE